MRRVNANYPRASNIDTIGWRRFIPETAVSEPWRCQLFILAAVSGPTINRTMALVFRYAFGLCMPVYGLVHFLYPAAVANWVPNWLPGHMFWAYFTGVAHCAAGVAVLTGVLARLATKLFALMISLWIFLMHIERVVATPHDRHEWTTLFIAVAICGAAWVLAGSYEVLAAKRKS